MPNRREMEEYVTNNRMERTIPTNKVVSVALTERKKKGTGKKRVNKKKQPRKKRNENRNERERERMSDHPMCNLVFAFVTIYMRH